MSKIAAPAGVCAALAVAVGVWLIPSGVLDPRPAAPPASKPMPGVKPPTIEPPAVVEVDWTTLIQKLGTVREPITDVADTENPGGDHGIANPPPPVPTGLSLNWQYEGYVAEGDRLIALVRIQSIQRFVFLDQEIVDPSIPGYGRATVMKIEPERLVVNVGGAEVEVKRTSQGQTNELIRAQPSTAGELE